MFKQALAKTVKIKQCSVVEWHRHMVRVILRIQIQLPVTSKKQNIAGPGHHLDPGSADKAIIPLRPLIRVELCSATPYKQHNFCIYQTLSSIRSCSRAKLSLRVKHFHRENMYVTHFDTSSRQLCHARAILW